MSYKSYLELYPEAMELKLALEELNQKLRLNSQVEVALNPIGSIGWAAKLYPQNTTEENGYPPILYLAKYWDYENIQSSPHYSQTNIKWSSKFLLPLDEVERNIEAELDNLSNQTSNPQKAFVLKSLVMNLPLKTSGGKRISYQGEWDEQIISMSNSHASNDLILRMLINGVGEEELSSYQSIPERWMRTLLPKPVVFEK